MSVSTESDCRHVGRVYRSCYDYCYYEQ